MRVFGHPLHVMLVHFPIALWPAHAGLHAFGSHLPPGVAAVAGFWVLAAGTLVGCGAAILGALDWFTIAREDARRLCDATVHGMINGSVLLGFALITALEYSSYPAIQHGPAFQGIEAALLVAMFTGNYFGGAVVWRPPGERLKGRARYP